MNSHDALTSTELRKIAEHFNLALEAHQAGKLEEAEEGYRAVLGMDPLHVSARNNLALIYYQLGELATALELLEETVSIRPDFADAWNNLGSVKFSLGDVEGARIALLKAIELGHRGAPINLARLSARVGDAETALKAAEKAYALNPCAEAVEIAARAAGTLKLEPVLRVWLKRWLEMDPGNRDVFLACVDVFRGKVEILETLCRLHLQADPNDPAGWNSLGVALQSQKKHAEAEEAFRRAIELAPQSAEPYNNRAVALKSLGRLEEALAEVEKAITLKSDYPEAYNTKGNILSALERLDEALASYNEAIRLKPDFIEAHANALLALSDLGKAEEGLKRLIELETEYGKLPIFEKVKGILLVCLERFEEAEKALRFALSVFPDDAEVQAFLGASLHMLGFEGEAEDFLTKAIPRLARPVVALNALGNLYASLGRKKEAEETLKRAIEIAPDVPGLYRNLAGVYKFGKDDPYLRRLEALYDRLEELSASDQVELLYALAEAYRDIGENERAFDLFLEAGKRRRSQLDFDVDNTIAMMAALAQVFTRERFLALQGKGFPTRLPVFIVGMPRSGTTLMEQILAAHPKVFGAGELRLLGESLGYGLMIDGVHLDGMPKGESDPSKALPIEEGLFSLGERYVTSLRRYSLTAWRITDKMPGNFVKVPLIALAMPGAKIIHMRRHPLDTCLSCFTMRFTQGQEWSYDLVELGRYYSAYWQLMKRWRQVCPESFIEVEYERLVTDTEEEVKRVLDYVELPWDERCLRFYEHERPVHTASLAQVRQPIYKTSMGKWKHFVHKLKPLIEALDKEILETYGI